MKNKLEREGLSKEIFDHFLAENEYGITALLALSGFSSESLKRLITLIRIVDDEALTKLSLKEKWQQPEDLENFREWSDASIARKIKEDHYFRKGIVNIFFEGATVPFLANTIPLFELKKLSISKLNFDMSAMLDTLVRYKEKGSYSGKKGNNPETTLAAILDQIGCSYEVGDLSELITFEPETKRTMDFIIPNKANPVVIIECSFLITTSSGQGDKSKTEISISQLIKKHYPQAKFWGFVDGVGWYVRRKDLRRMVSAYEDVFTFHQDELSRFEANLRMELFKK